jgi:elongation factor G
MWKNHRINIIDTPGHVDFTVEVERSLRVLDGAIALFCAVGGVEPQSETVWRQADKYQVPRVAFINKMDRVGANFHGAMGMIKDRLGANVVPIQIPIGEGDMFAGLIDLIRMKAVVYDDASLGSSWDEMDIPHDLEEKAAEYRTILLESVSEYDDTLLEKYLEGHEIEEKDIMRAIRKATIDCSITPVLLGSAFKNKGVQRLLDAVLSFLPSPVDVHEIFGYHPKTEKEISRKPANDEPFSALAFKIMTDPYVGRLTYFRVYSGTAQAGSYVYNVTAKKRERLGRILLMSADKREDIKEVRTGDIVAAVGFKYTKTGDTLAAEGSPIVLESMNFPEPVIAVAIEPKTKADQEKLGISLGKLAEEDPTFKIKTDEETSQTVIYGMGELHLEILVDRLLREFKVGANVGRPQVAYKEAITKKIQAEGKFIRQSGGRGQYGHVVIEVEPAEPGVEFEFVDKIVGGTIPREYIRSVGQGIKEALTNGIIAGYPLVDVRATLLDGSYHDVDSSEMAFKVAGSMALKNAVSKAGPVLMEPIMDVEVVVPEEYMGEVMGDLNGRRGKIRGIFPREDAQVISASAPLSEMFGYATSLRSLTQGRAIFTLQFAKYDVAPKAVSEKVVESVNAA